ncbi:MAG TPA: hypothetical protein ACHBX0_03020 [Arsenophonus sp.]
MQYSFDNVVSRRGTYSAKWWGHNNKIVPFFISDMEFAAPDFVIDILAGFSRKGIYGYTLLSNDWQSVTADWY